MAGRKAFPLRIDSQVYEALERWAADELRSVNGQMEFLLREALRQSGRLPAAGRAHSDAKEDIFSAGEE